MYVCMYVCMYVYVYIYIYICVCVYLFCVCADTCLGILLGIFLCTKPDTDTNIPGVEPRSGPPPLTNIARSRAIIHMPPKAVSLLQSPVYAKSFSNTPNATWTPNNPDFGGSLL